MISVLPLKSNKFSVTTVHFPTNIADLLQFCMTSCLENIQIAKNGASLTVHSINPSQMRTMNWKYRKISKATDVLSISADAVPSEITMFRELGDIFLCMPIVFQKATKHQKPFQHYLIRLAIHGLLHLTGYDHETDEDHEKMINKEKRLLELFNIRSDILDV